MKLLIGCNGQDYIRMIVNTQFSSDFCDGVDDYHYSVDSFYQHIR